MTTTMRGLALLASLLAPVAGCHRVQPVVPGDTGTDADTDADGDGDSDTDGDTDTETDTGTGDCETAYLDLEYEPASLLVLLDRSRSMTTNEQDDLTYGEIAAGFVRDALIWFDEADRLNFGLAVFPSPSCPDGVVGSPSECAPAASDYNPVEPVAPDNSDAIDLALDAAGTCGGTPMCQSLAWARDHLLGGDFPPELADRPKHVLLVTDGAPNCNPDLDPQTCTCLAEQCVDAKQCLDDVCAEDAALQLAAADVPLFVAVVGDEGFEWGDVMDAIAVAGGTDAHYPVGQPQQNQAVIADLEDRAVGCTFAVDWGAAPDGPGKGCHALTVEAETGGVWEELTRSPGCQFPDGWRWVGEPPAFDETTDFEAMCTKIELCPMSCEVFKINGLQQVRGRLDCP